MKKIIFGLIVSLVFPVIAYAAPTESGGTVCTNVVSPRSVTQSSPGNLQWADLNNIIAEDDKEAYLDSNSKNHIQDVATGLILADGSVALFDKSNKSNWSEKSEYVSYGTEKLKSNLTSQDVNDPDFGFAFQIGNGIITSNFLKATNFGFQIPASASITGVSIDVKRREARQTDDQGNTLGIIDHIRMSVCHTSTLLANKDSLPFVLALVGDVKKMRVEPGELLSIPLSLQAFGVRNMSDVAIQYQILKDDVIKLEEIDSTKITNIPTFFKTIEIPDDFSEGLYEVRVGIVYDNKTVSDLTKFQFMVENKIVGVSVTQFLIFGAILLSVSIIIVIVGRLVALRYKKQAVTFDYSEIPEASRVYYQMISDMISQMHESIGDRAYKMADSIAGLSVDKATGKIIKITKDPSELVSILFIRYENVFKKKIKISEPTVSKKLNVDEFEKYFRKK